MPSDTAADTGTREANPRSATLIGAVATVAGTPLGLDDSAREQSAMVVITWDLNVADSEKGDPARGTYEHRGTSSLSVDVGGHGVTGSASATVNVYDGETDSFGMDDGSQILGDGHPRMALDGADNEALGLFFAIVDDDGQTLESDALPESLRVFDPGEDSHTFAISDAGGSLLLQFDHFVDGTPEN